MKVSVNAILTTLTGGCPVTTDTSDKTMSKLLEENTMLNASLPQFVSSTASKEEILEENINLKTEKLFELMPALKEAMEEEIMVARVALSNILIKKKGIDKQYLRICEMLIADAKDALLNPKTKSQLVDLKFEREA